jgi:hypothetical protein
LQAPSLVIPLTKEIAQRFFAIRLRQYSPDDRSGYLLIRS